MLDSYQDIASAMPLASKSVAPPGAADRHITLSVATASRAAAAKQFAENSEISGWQL
jgi:hypothetical protein